MSKLDELINELCPDGVEYKPLSDKTLFEFHYGRGNKIPEDIGGKYDVYGANGIVSHINEYNCEDISIIGHIGAVGFINRCKGKCFVTYNGTIANIVDKSKVNTQYFYYVLTTLDLPSYKKGSQPFLSVSDFDKIEIPVPPLPVQDEIVRILDTFTSLTAELTAELTARRKQYEYYRDSLLTRDTKVERFKIKDLFDTRNGYTPSTSNSDFWDNGTVPWFVMEDIRENGRVLSDSKQHITESAVKKSGLFPANSIIVATSATIGEHALITSDFLCNQRFTCLSPKTEYKSKIDMKYMFYYAFKLDEFCKRNTTKSSFASVDMGKFYDFEFPLPSLDVQQRIVNVLDNFDSICTDLKIGLPAEIEARQKQYEYYRDKLLTFEEKEV